MQIKIESVHINAVVVIQPECFQDERGFFLEQFRADQFQSLGLPHQFVQENHSGSVKNTLRGLHFQWDPPMGKLMRVLRGQAFLVAVDIRNGSPTWGKWYGQTIAAEDRKQIWAPAGFARGFCVLSEYAEIQYLCTGTYNQNAESAIRWNDPQIGIEWPVKDPILSEKDRNAMILSEWQKREEAVFFQYDPNEEVVQP